MFAVPSAPLRAALAAAARSQDLPIASKAGSSASIIVRSPSLAPPYSIMRASPAFKASFHDLPDAEATEAAAKKIASKTPDEPPMVRVMTSLTAARNWGCLASGILPKAAARCRAAAAIVEPVSPSPTRASSALSRASDDSRMQQALFTRVASALLRLGLMSPPFMAFGNLTNWGDTWVFMPGHTNGEAGDLRAASNSAFSGNKDSEKPCMSREDTRMAGPQISLIFLPCLPLSTSLVISPISSGVVDPRLLISRAYFPAFFTLAKSLPATVAAALAAFSKPINSTPGSPCSPSPSSALPLGIRSSRPIPGKVQEDSAMPSETSLSAAFWAIAATFANGRPFSA